MSIRNFAIIAHIDHGKSTLADRLLELTHTVESRLMKPQFLDQNPISRERGITIKLAPVRLSYNFYNNYKDYKNYMLNLIDTPGHADFSFEVVRSLSACEGAILLIDATQGIQGQSIANFILAKKLGLKIIPVINKIDLFDNRRDAIYGVSTTITQTFNFSPEEILYISAKTGQGVKELLEAIVEKIPPPTGKSENPLQYLTFNAQYDEFRGVVSFVKVREGILQKSAGILEVGYFSPAMTPVAELRAGEVGYLITGTKDLESVHIHSQKPQPLVFVTFFPVNGDDLPLLKEALAKFKLNDSSLSIELINSKSLGGGYRVGFLGLLHADVVQERLEREYNLDILAATPTVDYQFEGEITKEPYVKLKILTRSQDLGAIMELAKNRRAIFINMEYLTPEQVNLYYEIPLSELITDFYDRLKNLSSGYASMDYEFLEYRVLNAVTLDILINKEKVDALSLILPQEKVNNIARHLVDKLRDSIPRQQYEVRVQAAVGSQILASAEIKPFRKDVLQKLYGGDRTRKDKLLEAQKKGKKKMKRIGKAEIPQEAFFALLSRD
ncbi:MAG: GTP-binding protein [Patescibacteria group bacterium]